MEPKDILRSARISNGYTQEEIARKIGMSPRMYQRYEEGRFPKYKNSQIKKIDFLLKTNLNTIVYGQSPAGKKRLANAQVVRINDKNLEQVIGEIHTEILSLKITNAKLLKVIAILVSRETGKPMSGVNASFLKEIVKEVEPNMFERNIH